MTKSNERKIVQIAPNENVGGDMNDINSSTEIFALCDDGTILYSYWKSWTPGVPGAYTPWKILDIPKGDLIIEDEQK